ncbi:MAG: tetratricopeptide repeat protein [Candidatus Omnitrophica bacterium]|nr:tetratricopeptide repeat protein [Candidatus Omnitrophota bacterium]
MLFLAAVGAAVYHNSINSSMVFDDRDNIIRNVYIRSPQYLKEIFTSNFTEGAGHILPYYRPLGNVSYMIDYQFWKTNPVGYHLTNVALHLLNALLLALFLRALFQDELLALLTAFLFLIHPVNTEAVNYISARTDLLMFFFCLLSAWSYRLYGIKKGSLFLACSVLFYCLAVLCKETALLLPLVFFFARPVFVGERDASGVDSPKKKKKQVSPPSPLWTRAKPLLGFAGVFAVYGILRVTVLNFLGTDITQAGMTLSPVKENMVQRLLLFSKGTLVYVRLLFFPVGLHIDYDNPVLKPRGDPDAVAAAAFLVFLAFGGLWQGKKDKRVLFATVWILVNAIPISNAIPMITLIAERYLYLPSIGFFLVAAVAVMALYRRLKEKSARIGLATGVACVLTVMGIMTFQRNAVWADPIRFYKDTLAKTKKSFRIMGCLGAEYWRRGDVENAEMAFREAVKISPTYSVGLYNMGAVCAAKGDLDSAETYYRQALNSDPNSLLAMNGIAYVCIMKKRYGEAKRQLDEVLKRNPDNERALELLRFIPQTQGPSAASASGEKMDQTRRE